MFTFSIKKWFFDLWDHLFFAFIFNVAFLLVAAVPLALPGLINPLSPVLAGIVVVLGVLLAGWAAAILSRFAWDMARSERIDFSRIKAYAKDTLLPSLAFSGVNIAIVLVALTALPFYASQEGIISTLALGLVAWMILFWLVISQFYLPLNGQFEKRIFKLFKKSALLFMDNPGLTLGMLLVSILILVVSAITMSLFPGITGLLLWHQVCLKLRMYKYDYLETHPETPRKQIPWFDILTTEREKLGTRTLRNMIFPWKD